MLRFKITDFTAQQPIQNILIKLWRLVIQLQYDVKREKQAKMTSESPTTEIDPELELEYSILPVDMPLYDQVMFIFKRTLGVLYETDYYVAKKGEEGTEECQGAYLKEHVFFDRFCFDMVSLLGDYLPLLSFADVEYIMRKVYQHSTQFVLQPKQGAKQKMAQTNKRRKDVEQEQMEGVVKLLRYDCIESPFTWTVMTA